MNAFNDGDRDGGCEFLEGAGDSEEEDREGDKDACGHHGGERKRRGECDSGDGFHGLNGEGDAEGDAGEDVGEAGEDEGCRE